MKHWQRIVTAWMLAVAVLLAVHPASAQEGKKAPPVILDTDMVDWFDDGAAMILLAKSPKTDLLGVTVVLGNTWVETGTASAIRQLEGAGIKDVPVFMGVNAPVREDRFRYIAEEKSRFGRGADSHMGAAGYDRPVSWQDAYRKNYGAEPELRPMKQSAPDFIIQTVRARPHEVTIVSIGSGANLAAALRKDPEIAPLVKRVVYMAGSFFQQGNVMPYAEFNVWIDPEAMQAAFRAPFGDQVIVPLDACEKIHITRDRFFQMQKMVKNPVFADLIAMHALYRPGPMDDPAFQGQGTVQRLYLGRSGRRCRHRSVGHHRRSDVPCGRGCGLRPVLRRHHGLQGTGARRHAEGAHRPDGRRGKSLEHDF